MKKHYKSLLTILGIEILILAILRKYNFEVQSWIGNAIGIFVCILPLQILLFLASRDGKFSTWKKICFKILFWHINITYIASAIVTLLAGE